MHLTGGRGFCECVSRSLRCTGARVHHKQPSSQGLLKRLCALQKAQGFVKKKKKKFLQVQKYKSGEKKPSHIQSPGTEICGEGPSGNAAQPKLAELQYMKRWIEMKQIRGFLMVKVVNICQCWNFKTWQLGSVTHFFNNY